MTSYYYCSLLWQMFKWARTWPMWRILPYKGVSHSLHLICSKIHLLCKFFSSCLTNSLLAIGMDLGRQNSGFILLLISNLAVKSFMVPNSFKTPQKTFAVSCLYLYSMKNVCVYQLIQAFILFTCKNLPKKLSQLQAIHKKAKFFHCEQYAIYGIVAV